MRIQLEIFFNIYKQGRYYMLRDANEPCLYQNLRVPNE